MLPALAGPARHPHPCRHAQKTIFGMDLCGGYTTLGFWLWIVKSNGAFKETGDLGGPEV